MDEMRSRVTLSERRRDAFAAFQTTGAALDTVQEQLQSVIGENQRSRILGAMALNVLWAVFAVAAYLAAVRYCGGWLGLPMVISTVILAALMLISQAMRLSHFKTMLDDLDRAAQLRRELERHAGAADARYGELLLADSAGWDVPLNASPSVPGEVDRISRRLQGMQAFDDGKMQRLLAAVFFVTAVLWTLFAAGSLHDQAVQAATDLILLHATAHTAEVIFYVMFGLASVAAVLGSIFLWTSTHMRVTNTTLLSFFTGPAAFVILMVLVHLSVVLLVIAIVIVVIIIWAAISN